MRHHQRMMLTVVLSLLALLTGPALAGDESGSRFRNSWTQFPQGAWVLFDWSEQWGTNPPTSERRRTIIIEHRSIGTSLTEIQRQQAGSWNRVTGGLHGAFAPGDEGMTLRAETAESTLVLGLPTTCRRREYVHDEADGSGQRLLLWHCDGVNVPDRVLPQWSVSFGWQLASDVGRARIERRDTVGAVTSVELELEAQEEVVYAAGRPVECFRERLVWRHRMNGQPEGKITTETTRWISAEVPGLVARQIEDNQIGRITKLELADFALD